MAEVAEASPSHLETLEAALALSAEPTEETKEAPPEAPAEAAPADDAEQPGDEGAEAPETPDRMGIRSLSEDQLVALRRAQISDSDLEGLSDAALAKLADTAIKLRSNADRAFHAERASKAPTEASPTKAEDGAGKAAAPHPSTVDVAALADPVRKALGLDGEEGKVLTEFTRQIISAAQAAFAPALADAQRDAASANQRVGSMLADTVMDGLEGMWPQLKDAKKREDVRKHAQKIAEGYEHLPLKVGMTECLRDACRRVIGEPKAAAQAARQPDARDRATPAKPTGNKPVAAKPKTADELHLAIVRGLDEGLSTRTIAKRVGIT